MNAKLSCPSLGLLEPEQLGLILFVEDPDTELIVRVESASEAVSKLFTGPIIERTTGNRTRPWNRPNMTVSAKTYKFVIIRLKVFKAQFTLKNVMKT